MSTSTYEKVVIKKHAVGVPTLDNFDFVSSPIPTEADLKEGELLVRVLYLSVDPYMRSRIGAQGMPVGSTIVGGSVSEVVISKSPNYKPGDVINTYTGWTEYAVVNSSTLTAENKLDTSAGIPLSLYNGAVGMPGLTAYFGLFNVLEIQRDRDSGKTLLVTGAAGAVGAVVCQIAKIYGLRVVGVAGSADKVAYLKDELGVDVAVNYKSSTLEEDFKAALPKGIDYFFENVGGPVSDSLYKYLNARARVAICGQIAIYNATTQEELVEPRFLHLTIYKSIRFEGFVVSNYHAEFPKALKELSQWVKDGKIKVKEDIMEGGIRAAPAAFFKLFNGSNFGKQSVHIATSQFGHK